MHQPDIFHELNLLRDERIAAQGWPCLYASTARGLVARATEFEDWIRHYGDFGCVPRSRAWLPAVTDPGQTTDHCLATVLVADLRCHCSQTCMCVGSLVHRGACCSCIWEGPIRTRRKHAVLDALDHACPGWRTDPAVAPPRGHSQRARAKWAAEAKARIGDRPDGWPIQTQRTGPGYAPVARRSPWGGYNIDTRTLL